MSKTILFLGTITSENLLNKRLIDQTINANLAAQKYHRLLLEAFALDENMQVIAITRIESINRFKHLYRRGFTECANGVKFIYLSESRITILQFVLNLVEVFLIIRKLNSNLVSKVFLGRDYLKLWSSIYVYLVNIFFNLKTFATLTDLPAELFIHSSPLTLRERIYLNLISKYSVDNIIAVRKNLVLASNIIFKNYVIVEGIVDSVKLENDECQSILKTNERIFHYSGGLYKEFGITVLIEAFMGLECEDCRLHLFGKGFLQDYIIEKCNEDNRIKYFGQVPNSVILLKQKVSFALVNPRLTLLAYNNNTFPSKMLEYLNSGIPFLTTDLPSIPNNLRQYCNMISFDNVEGVRDAMHEILVGNNSILKNRAIEAQAIVQHHYSKLATNCKLQDIF